MISFAQFNDLLQKHVNSMTSNVNYLYETDVDSDVMWNLYLDSFPEGTNPIYRVKREFDCSCCRHFIKSFGNVVVLNGDNITTIWDFQANDPAYQAVIDALSSYVKSKRIRGVFVTPTVNFGVKCSYEQGSDKVIKWDHFNVVLNDRYKTNKRKDELGGIISEYNNSRQVFERSVKELTDDSVETALELIAQNSLYRGLEWKEQLKKLLQMKKNYVKSKNKDYFCWINSMEAGPALSRIRNSSIGTFLVDLSEGMDLEKALVRYERVTAPTNYKRPNEVFTKKMVEDAEKVLQDSGLIDSLGRRHASLEDITINNILFADRSISNMLNNVSIFDEMKKDAGNKPKNFDRIEEIGIEDFIKNVIPNASSIQLYLENKHQSNMVSLIAPKNINSPSLFKWNNGFSWAYSGNVTDSIKDNVKTAGGKVDGVLRFSIQWNDKGNNNIDFDAHCERDDFYRICYSNKVERDGGNLDVDIISPSGKVAVENITWPNLKDMVKGQYRFYVHNFSSRDSEAGFNAEIEFNGEIYQFSYDRYLKGREKVKVATVEYDGVSNFTITEDLKATSTPKNIWGLKTMNFHPVQVCMYSPNYWDNQTGIGNKHYMFMLKGAVSNDNLNGFFNEYLKEEFMKHKRVFAALGKRMQVEQSETQLSGVGFSATKRADLIVKVEGKFTRTLKIKI